MILDSDEEIIMTWRVSVLNPHGLTPGMSMCDRSKASEILIRWSGERRVVDDLPIDSLDCIGFMIVDHSKNVFNGWIFIDFIV